MKRSTNNRSNACTFENLEHRQMFAVVVPPVVTGFDTATATLNVYGTAGDDVITLSKVKTTTGTNIRVTIATNGGAVTTVEDFPEAIIQKIKVNGLEGKDSLTIGSSITRQACTLNGGLGDDTLSSGTTKDVFNGDEGYDSVSYATRTTNLSVSLDGVANDGAGTEGDNVTATVERVYSGRGNDTLRGNNVKNSLYGGPGNDTVYAGGGNDNLYGEAGSDQLFGESGDDMLDGGAGFDTLNGSSGADGYISDGDLVLAKDGEFDLIVGSCAIGSTFDPLEFFLP